MGAVILILLIVAVVVMVVGVVGWMSGWWLTTETDAHGEPDPRPEAVSDSEPDGPRPTHTTVEDEANQEIVGEADEPR